MKTKLVLILNKNIAEDNLLFLQGAVLMEDALIDGFIHSPELTADSASSESLFYISNLKVKCLNKLLRESLASFTAG